jgi:hypothetical protein
MMMVHGFDHVRNFGSCLIAKVGAMVMSRLFCATSVLFMISVTAPSPVVD